MTSLYDLHKVIMDDIKISHKDVKEKYNKFYKYHNDKGQASSKSVSVVDFTVPDNNKHQMKLYKDIQKQAAKLEDLCSDLKETQNLEINLELTSDEHGELVKQSIDTFIHKIQKYMELLAEIKEMIEHKTKSMHGRIDYILLKSRVLNGGSPKAEQYFDTISHTYDTYTECINAYKKFITNVNTNVLKSTESKPDNVIIVYSYVHDMHHILLTFNDILSKLKENLQAMTPYLMFRKQKRNIEKCTSMAKEKRQEFLRSASKILDTVKEPHEDIQEFKTFIQTELQKADLVLAERILRDILHIVKPKYTPSNTIYEQLLDNIQSILTAKSINQINAKYVKDKIERINISVKITLQNDGFRYYTEYRDKIIAAIDDIIRPEKLPRKTSTHNKTTLKDNVYNVIMQFLEKHKIHVSSDIKAQISKIIVNGLNKKAYSTSIHDIRKGSVRDNKVIYIWSEVIELLKKEGNLLAGNIKKHNMTELESELIDILIHYFNNSKLPSPLQQYHTSSLKTPHLDTKAKSV
jgi:hypothetical protein